MFLTVLTAFCTKEGKMRSFNDQAKTMLTLPKCAKKVTLNIFCLKFKKKGTSMPNTRV